ncbi:unnamed protein product [Rotaria socialis]|uniref:DUF4246 domain-containing protein n=1 Tax=Rotaria socialis TaxID=392032 RepID=A0A820V284_9BILA|nr:unnamed protein product [Rotaria socialis]CAF4494262.1 unnamed protein product [Rotaria socialis]
MASASASTPNYFEVKCDRLTPVSQFNLNDFINNWLSIHIENNEKLSILRSPRRTHHIEEFPCLVYLVECHRYKRIRVWLKEREVKVEKCSDYMYERYSPDHMQSCWVCKWLEWDNDWLIGMVNIDEKTIVKTNFYRLIGDRYVEYGDPGKSFLVYPVWVQDHLEVRERVREYLLDTLQTLNEERSDHHAIPSPVEDIIDPDLLACRPPSFDRAKWIEHQLQQLQPFRRALRDFQRDLVDGEYDELSWHEQLRDTYQWLPSEFVIQTDGKVDIRKPILHLPMIPKYHRSYGAIAKIFHAMLPMFQQIKLISKGTIDEQRLQVIVKAQNYNMKAGKTNFEYESV